MMGSRFPCLTILRVLTHAVRGFALAAILSGIAQAESAPQEPTPMAGGDFRTKLFGEEIHVAPRDRRSVTAASFGLQWIPEGPAQLEVLPFGALYVWRNWDDDNRRFRGTIS